MDATEGQNVFGTSPYLPPVGGRGEGTGEGGGEG